MNVSPEQQKNPYVGPYAFARGQQLYGRERETQELLNLLIAERILLIYSPSGAGKTSLLQAALIPELEKRKFQVLESMRVGKEPPPDFTLPQTTNRYIFSLLLSLEEGKPKDTQFQLDRLATISLVEYLEQVMPEQDEDSDQPQNNIVLIFDQFEEIITIEPTEQDTKHDFFEQLGEALEDRHIWALFAMREEYVTRLDPFLDWIPNQLHDTFRLDLLKEQAAFQAIYNPAKEAGVEFDQDAVSKLVNDLQQVRIPQPDGNAKDITGLYIEPLQLQVVCYRLWEQLPDGKTCIELTDVQTERNVTTTLADYYADCVQEVATKTNTNERAIRDWFEQQLITGQRIRGQAPQGTEVSYGLTNAVVATLEDARLVRAEERRGAIWYELSHDRLIEPIIENNAAWREKHLSELQKRARSWQQDRLDGLLLKGTELLEAEQWLKTYDGKLSQTEQDFLDKCRDLHNTAERDRRNSRVIRVLVAFVLVIAFVAASALFWSNEQRKINEQQLKVNEEQVKINQVQILVLQAQTEFKLDPERGLLLAIEAAKLKQNPLVETTLRQAIQESHVRLHLKDHKYDLSSVSFSPDSKYVTTSTTDTVRLWDSQTGKLLKFELQGEHKSIISQAVFSPDGEYIVTASWDSTVRFWDRKTGEQVRIFKNDKGPIWSIAFSPDGQYIAFTGLDTMARVWNVQTDDILELQGHTESIKKASFSRDSQHIVTASYDGTARVWDSKSGKELCKLIGHGEDAEDDNVIDAVFSLDGKSIATAGVDTTARIWNTKTCQQEVVMYGHSDEVLAVDFSPDGKRIATASADRTAQVWDIETGRGMILLRGHQDVVVDVAFHPDGKHIVTASKDNTTNLWNVESGKEVILLYGHSDDVRSVDFSPDGNRIVSASLDKTARVWKTTNGIWDKESVQEELILQGHEDSVVRARFSPNGKYIVTASRDRTARVWDATNGKEIHKLENHRDEVNDAAFSNDPDGQYIVTAGNDGTARVWNTKIGEEIRVLESQASNVLRAAFSPDGKYIVTTSRNNAAYLWEWLRNIEQKPRVFTHTGIVNSIAFSPDDKHVVTASDDNTARVWDIETGTQLLLLKGHGYSVLNVKYSTDGKHIITTSADETIRYWNAHSGKQIRVLYGRSTWIDSAEFSPNGNYIASGGGDDAVHLYYAHFDDVLQLAKERATRELTPEEREMYLLDRIE